MKTKTILDLLEPFRKTLSEVDFARIAREAMANADARLRRGGFSGLFSDLSILCEILRGGADGSIPVAKRVLLTIASVLAYFLCPVDAVPDVVPLVGLADDASVLAWAIATLAPIISAFRVR